MSEEDKIAVIICLISGFMVLLVGLSIRIGLIKRWWLMASTPIVPTNFAYVAIPASLLFLILPALIIVFPNPTDRQGWLFNLGCPILIVVILFSVWPPRWLVPGWLQWLTDNHKAILPLLQDEARKMGKQNWEQRVRTQEGLEKWVTEVRQKHKLDHPDQRFIGNPHPD
jgi:hypothetical protein